MKAIILVAPLAMILSACSSASAGGGPGDISITASSGTLTAGAAGTWTFDTGYVAVNTADVITFTVKNTTSQDFSATGSAFTNTDFSDNIAGTFAVPAGGSASFTGTFKPTSIAGSQETDTLTLTPSGGTPIVLHLQGTSGAPSFLIVSPTSNYLLATTVMINNVGTGDIAFGPNPISISNTVNFTLDTSGTSLSLKAAGSTPFALNGNLNPSSTAVTITGQDSIAGAFSYTFTFFLHPG